MDGLTIWKNILNLFKENVGKDYYRTMFGDEVLKYYDYINGTIYLMCENDFVRDNVEKNLEKLYAVAKRLDFNDLKIKPIRSDQEIVTSYKKLENSQDGIIDKFTFDSFVTGPSNKFAYAACVSVAEMPSFESPKNAYNPLFLYGGAGLGKTHLMHAIGNEIKNKNKGYKILYLSSETFTNELITALKEKKNEEFRDKYRNLDCLLIDDIQFIARKESTQEEIFYTFEALHKANKQIIISSDKPPKEIATLESRLSSRFQSGLTVDIQPPDFETRMAILRKKSELDEKYVSDDILVLIAKNIKSNIRELEGALNKVWAISSMMKEPITYDLAIDALKDFFDATAVTRLDINAIKNIVAQNFNISIEDFASERRTKDIAYPRQIAMYMARELTDMSLPSIGREFGDRDHTTVMHAHKKIKKDIMQQKDGVDIKINNMIRTLKQNVDNW